MQFNLPHVLFAPSLSPTFGNALLSRFPFISHAEHKLEACFDDDGRSMICVKVDIGQVDHAHVTEQAGSAGDNKAPQETEELQQAGAKESTAIQVVLTHLDHRNEEMRMAQMAEVWAHIDRERPHIIMGDFNCLRKIDYGDESWDMLTRIRQNNKWELPVSTLTDTLEKDGCTDCWRIFHTEPVVALTNIREKGGAPRIPGTDPGCRQSIRAPPGEDPLFRLSSLISLPPPPSHSWAGTRIDYFWVSARFPFRITACERLHTDASDHFPILMRLTLGPEGHQQLK